MIAVSSGLNETAHAKKKCHDGLLKHVQQIYERWASPQMQNASANWTCFTDISNPAIGHTLHWPWHILQPLVLPLEVFWITMHKSTEIEFPTQWHMTMATLLKFKDSLFGENSSIRCFVMSKASKTSGMIKRMKVLSCTNFHAYKSPKMTAILGQNIHQWIYEHFRCSVEQGHHFSGNYLRKLASTYLSTIFW